MSSIPGQAQQVKDPLPWLWCWSQLWLGFKPWPGNYILWVCPLPPKKSHWTEAELGKQEFLLRFGSIRWRRQVEARNKDQAECETVPSENHPKFPEHVLTAGAMLGDGHVRGKESKTHRLLGGSRAP